MNANRRNLGFALVGLVLAGLLLTPLPAGHAAGPRSVGGSTVLPDLPDYQAGAYNTYQLRVTNNSVDGEFLGRVEVTFPAGWVITTLIGDIQACSWEVDFLPTGLGTNHATFFNADVPHGSVPPECTWIAIVTVHVPAGTSGDQVVTWGLWGDGLTGAPPHEVAGQFTLTRPATAPTISIHPPELEAILPAGGQQPNLLNIRNDGAADMTWSLAEDPAVTWLNELPTFGRIPPGGQNTLQVAFNTVGIPAGSYETALVITCSDPAAPLVEVPVELTVQPTLQVFLPVAFRDYSPNWFYGDDFEDPNSGWSSGDDDGRTWGYIGGEYQIVVKEPYNGWLVTPDLVLPASYRIAVDARQVSAKPGSYGLAFGLRVTESGYETHQFLIYPDSQEYFVEKRSLDGTWTTLVDWTYSAAIHPGAATNRLRVDRIGSAIHLYVNDSPVASLVDTDYTSAGRDAGLRAYSGDDAPVEMRFDNLVVYSVP